MAHVVIVGGGPAGLSAALYAAINGLETTFVDTVDGDVPETSLLDYLGVETGTEAFINSIQARIEELGVKRISGNRVRGITKDGSEFLLETDDAIIAADYVILATGSDSDLAESLGCEYMDEGVVSVDLTMETSVSNSYATGAMVRPLKQDAIIAASDGAAAALDILSKEAKNTLAR